jgi:hypothetical protein
MRCLLVVLFASVMSLPTLALERKAAAEQVRKQGIVAYDVEEASDGGVRIRLVRRGSESAPAQEV